MGGYIGADNSVLVCGGFTLEEGEAVDTCYKFEDNDNNDGDGGDGDAGLFKWTELEDLKLDTKRGDAAVVAMDQNTLWIAGQVFLCFCKWVLACSRCRSRHSSVR